MSLIRLPLIASISAVILLQACANTPGSANGGAGGESIPELTLNLPQQPDVLCPGEEGVDYTFLDKGFSALVAGDHIEAVRYFQRYQRLESSPAADWESGIAIAYDSMLAQSPFYDPQAAVKSFLRLRDAQPQGSQLHDKVLMMRDALATFAAMNSQLTSLRRDNAVLAEDLEKREEALRRLRELALGQKGATP